MSLCGRVGFWREELEVSDQGFGFVPHISFLFPVLRLVGIEATVPSFAGDVWELLDALGLLDTLRGSGQERSPS